MKRYHCIGVVILLIALTSNFNVYSQSQTSETSSIEKVIKDFQAAIVQKDSILFKSLFFDKQTPVIGVMSVATELSIKKDIPHFEGLSVSNSDRFVREICKSPKRQSEKFEKISIDQGERMTKVSFDYASFADDEVFQWGEENWSLVFAENQLFITDINYTIRYPTVEKVPDYFNND